MELIRRQATTALGRDTAHPLFSLSGQGISGETDDGWTFEANTAYLSNERSNYSVEAGGHTTETTLFAQDWRLTAADPSSFWVTTLHAEFPAYLGNLTLKRTDVSFELGHYFLRGPACDYALVYASKDKGRWLLIAAPHAGTELSHGALRRDLNALALSFGTPIDASLFWRVNEDLRVRGVLDARVNLGDRQRLSEQAPVPSTNDLRGLPAVFFAALTKFLASASEERAAPLTQAAWFYLEALGERTAPATLVKMGLSAIVSARAFLVGQENIVRDRSVYSAWLASQDTALTALESSQHGTVLRKQIAHAADLSPIGAVRLAMAQAGLERLPEFEKALEDAEASLAGRATPRETFYESIACLRALSATLMARVIQYRGAVAGWRRAGEYSFYEPAPPNWSGSDDEVESTHYVGAFTGELPEATLHWPRVEVPRIPDSGVIGVLQQQASTLSQATDGRVYAQLHPLPLEALDEPRRFEFALHAGQLRTTKVSLFFVHPFDDHVAIEGWDEPVSLHDDGEARAFLQRIVNAPSTRAAIERLLLASMEAAEDVAF